MTTKSANPYGPPRKTKGPASAPVIIFTPAESQSLSTILVLLDYGRVYAALRNDRKLMSSYELALAALRTGKRTILVEWARPLEQVARTLSEAEIAEAAAKYKVTISGFAHALARIHGS
jgi:hypothetical protein